MLDDDCMAPPNPSIAVLNEFNICHFIYYCYEAFGIEIKKTQSYFVMMKWCY